MARDAESRAKRLYSRREFLKGVPIGIGGVFVLAVISRRLLGLTSRWRSQPPAFPEGSIFTPAKDRHTDL